MAHKIRPTFFVDESSHEPCSFVEEHNFRKHCHMSHENQTHPHPPCGPELLLEWGLQGGGGGQALGCGLLLFVAVFGAASVAAFVLAFRVIGVPVSFSVRPLVLVPVL